MTITTPVLPYRSDGQADPTPVSTERMRRALAERVGTASARHPWRTVGIWAAAVLVSLVLAATVLGGLTSDGHVVGATPSSRAQALYDQVNPAAGRQPTEVVVVRSASTAADTAAFHAEVTHLAAQLRSLPGVTAVTSDVSPGSPLVAADGHAAVVTLREAADSDSAAVVHQVQAADGVDGYRVTITGQHTVNSDASTLAASDLQTGEMEFGLPIALIVLMLVFGAVASGLLPVLMAVLSIAVGMGIASILSTEFHLSTFIINMMTAMGLALGIDYSLFIVSRYREERAAGHLRDDAIRRSAATAGQAVLFSGTTFAIALVAMFLVPTNVMRSLAAGAIIVGVVSVATALTLLPALLALLGDRIDAGRLPRRRRSSGVQESDRWRVLVAAVVRRPAVATVAVGALLVLLAVPATGLHLGQSGVATLPGSAVAKQGYLALERSFPTVTPTPVEIVAEGNPSSVRQGLERLDARLSADPAFGPGVLQGAQSSPVQTLTVPIQGDAGSSADVARVADLRARQIPAAFAGTRATVLVGGQTASTADYFHAVSTPTPIVLLFVLAASFVLLLLAFRSPRVALVSLLLNLLGVGAAYGLLTLVFVHGVGAGLFGFERVTAIDAWVPLFLFSVLFALSMDYQVFIMSRVKERFDLTGDARDAVVHGVSSTARIITGAALIIIVVFAGFAQGQLVMFQEMGFGVAVALLLDATLVRLVLLPALLTLLGARAWSLPRWLAWLPHVEIEPPADRVAA